MSIRSSRAGQRSEPSRDSSRGDDVRRIGTDPAAFEAFYREHVDAVERFVVRRVTDPHRAADLTAEVFLAAIESADGYRPSRGAPVAWLYGVARNVLAADRDIARRRPARSRSVPPSGCRSSPARTRPRRPAPRSR